MTINKNTDLEFSLQKGTEKGGVYTNFYTEDKGSASIRIRLSSNEYYLDLTKTDLKPVLFLFHEDGSIFEIRDFINVMPDKGLIQYNLADNVIAHAGKVKAKLFLKNTEQSVHVANFDFVIKDSGIEGAVAKEVNVNIVNDAVRRIVKENAIEILGDDFEERLNTDVINHLDSNLELFKGDKGDVGPQGPQGIQGPKGDKGDTGVTPDITLYENESNFINKKINEKSFMNFLEENSATTNQNYINIVGDRNLNVELMKSDKEKFILKFQKNSIDDFLKFRTVDLITSGPVTERFVDYDSTMVNNPTAIKGSGNNYYANEIGTKITFEFNGTSIKFRYFSATTGGVWKASIDGEFIKNISTHSSNQLNSTVLPSSTWEQTISSNLSNESHVLELEFIGQDSDYPVESPRGWIKTDNTNSYNLNTFSYESSEFSSIKVLTDSNKEFAFETRYDDVREWIPQHNNVGTLKLNDKGSQKLFIDGKEFSINDELSSTQFNEVKILQHLYGVRSSNNLEVCEMISVTTITSRGVKFNTKFKWLTETLIANGYVNMFTVHPDFADTLVTSYGGNYNMKQYDGEYEYIQEDAPYSFVALSNTYPDFYVTCDNVNGYRTLRLGEPNVSGDKYGKGLFGLQHRDNTLQKLYPKTYLQHTTSVDEVYEFEGFYGFGKLPMANELLK